MFFGRSAFGRRRRGYGRRRYGHHGRGGGDYQDFKPVNDINNFFFQPGDCG